MKVTVFLMKPFVSQETVNNEAETGDRDEITTMEEKWDSYCDREKKQIYFAHS